MYTTVNNSSKKYNKQNIVLLQLRSLFVLPASKMAGKIILVFTQMSTHIALKGLLEPVAAHVNRVQNIVSEVYVTVATFLRDFLVSHFLVR